MNIKCNECWNEDIICHEVYWAYDWWLYIYCKECDINYHRTNNEEIEISKQPTEYWPVFFKTTTERYRNLYKITEEQYESAT